MSIAETRFRMGFERAGAPRYHVGMTLVQTNYAQATYDYLVAKAEWDYAVGIEK